MAEEITTQSDAQVTEIPEAIELKNPYLTVVCNVFGLDENRRTGVHDNVMKSARAWLRARGVYFSRVKGIQVENFPEAGDTVEIEGEQVVADLRVITVTKDCVIKNDIHITPPKARGRQVTETVSVNTEPAPDVSALPEPDPAAAETEAQEDAVPIEEAAPSDW